MSDQPAHNQSRSLLAVDLEALLSLVSSREAMSAHLAERRQLFINNFAHLLNAQMGCWSWGRGGLLQAGVVPVAVIDYGMTDVHRTILADLGLQRSNDVEFREKVISLMNGQGHATAIWQDIYSQDEWDRSPSIRRISEALGMKSWVLCVRYVQADVWCCLTFWRGAEQPDFGERERQLVDLAGASIEWLHPTASESLPPQIFDALTPRQRSVLTLLLDGMSRKAVANHLQLTEYTVGDHVKSIYQVLNVHSLGELTALLLKSR